jgi:transposase-like protein
MTKTRKKHERDQWDDLPDKIDFKGLTQDEVLGQGGFLKQLTGRVLQKTPEASNLWFALTEHPVYERHDNAGDHIWNNRNGHNEKAVSPGNQGAAILMPRERNGTFEPEIVPKYQERTPRFNDQIIPM